MKRESNPGDGGGDRPRSLIHGSVEHMSEDPMSRGNVYANTQAPGVVLDSPNGPIQYKNPNHPWLTN